VSGLQFAYLLTGSLVFTEVVFNWPGIGLQVYNAVTSRDIPMIQGIVLLSGVVFVVVNLVVDVLHALVDPRSRQRVDA
jgi:peptide/nickel transport system permease protein